MDIGEAIKVIKGGGRVARSGWNGADMWIAYSPGHENLPPTVFWSTANHDYAQANGGADVLPAITMKNARGKIVMGWLASQEDLLSDDWFIVE